MKAINRMFKFQQDIVGVLSDHKIQRNFRYQSLMLIQKHFKIEYLSFVIHENIKEDVGCKSSLDNITLGITEKMVSEYYSKYQDLDPFCLAQSDEDIVSMFDIINEEDFLNSRYYKEFYSKSPIYYQTVGYIRNSQNDQIAHISFGRTKEDGPFTEDDLKNIKEIMKIISIEFLKGLQFKELMFENLVLRNQNDIFPIGQIIMDSNYNICSYNNIALEFIEELTGVSINYFKYFFVNELLGDSNRINDIDNLLLDNGDFIFKIILNQNLEGSITSQRINYIIYIVRKITPGHKYNNNLSKLSQREREVSNLIRLGYSNREIADVLEISPFTVKSHVQKIFEKCDSSNRIQLINKLYIEG